ncbi:MAG: type IA DNA topoisomerase [Eubacterium sp.]|nr:type IA DNA topoisomerase [Eubacterium sp.]
MGKNLFIAEKPSVGQAFAAAMKVPMQKRDGYLEGEKAIITWCYGHLVTMSYPEEYDPSLKKWNLSTLPFLPEKFKYEVIKGSGAKQFETVKRLLTREDVTGIYVCTDSGREGEYIYRLVDEMAGVSPDKEKRRVWIDSQTDEEIIRGIKEARPLSDYDNLSDAAYLRAKEDYLMGINFSRLLTLKYGRSISNFENTRYTVIAVGRVMTCVLGLVVRRERQIREFVKTPFYRVACQIDELGAKGEWRNYDGSRFFASPDLYKDSGFLKKETALECVDQVAPGLRNPSGENPDEANGEVKAKVVSISRKSEKKKPPLLYNLAELQNECSKRFKISPDETLKRVQELYEKKLVTYPRTDARVLSTAVAKEIEKNISGLCAFTPLAEYAGHILENGLYKDIAKTQYVNDKKITDHYALIPTGKGVSQVPRLSQGLYQVYELICRRFLSIFYPPAVFRKVSLTVEAQGERFVSNFKVTEDEGYLVVAPPSGKGKNAAKNGQQKDDSAGDDSHEDSDEEVSASEDMLKVLSGLRKGSEVTFTSVYIKEGETKPPKRYTSGSMILAMENAGQLIEDEELRSQIKGAGIGTSATRAEILNKLVAKKYINLNKKTQVLTPRLLGEMIYDVVDSSIRQLLNPELTASWEKGLSMVEQGDVTTGEYMEKLEKYIRGYTDMVKQNDYSGFLRGKFNEAARYYK